MKKTDRVRAGIAAALTALVVGGLATPALAHGTSQVPLSRALGCYQAGVNDWPGGQTGYDGCDQGHRLGGPNVFDNWNEVVIGDARQGSIEPQYRALIPDGQLCSAGTDRARGLDVATASWPTTVLEGGAETELFYRATAAHNPYTFSYYVTKDGYDASRALTWDDLEPTPFLVADSVPATNGGTARQGFDLPVLLPEKEGRHVIYTIWQGNIKKDGSVQSNEAFFACSDVDFR